MQEKLHKEIKKVSSQKESIDRLSAPKGSTIDKKKEEDILINKAKKGFFENLPRLQKDGIRD